ncbi:MAG: hypothetical protein LBU27_01605 [Candidatus Peribacteria bacterium]|nr:hypothetical protein [Candidatus Peribacteria bacterium]
MLSGEVASSELPVVRIVSVLPNPSGTDSEKEEITLVWTNPFILESLNAEEILSVSEKSPLPPLTPPRSTAGSPLGGENLDGGSETLSLSPDFYLLINNKTKKKLNGMLLPNQHITIKGSFSFPNTASCITLMKGAEPIDSFCYGAAKENVRYTTNNVAVQEIPETELSVVKKITLVRQGEKLCISYNKVLFGCKVIPNSTTEQNRKLLSFQNTYIANVQEYLRQQYSLLYYNSELQDLFDLYTTTKKAIKS